MKLSKKSRELLQELEGFRGEAYRDIGGVWTIGYGRTNGVKQGDTCSDITASMWLTDDLRIYEECVDGACLLTPAQVQFDAMVLLCYNIGCNAFVGSTVVKAHNRGDFTAAAKAFGFFNKVKKKVVPGLVRRRALEASLYLKPGAPADGAPPAPTPAPDVERPMAESKINLAGTAASIVATGTAVQQTMQVVNSVKKEAHDLEAWLLPSLIFLVAGICAYIVWERFQQRKRGDA